MVSLLRQHTHHTTWLNILPLLFAPQLDKALDKLTILTAYKSWQHGGKYQCKHHFFAQNSIFQQKRLKHQGWPTPPALYRSEVGQQSLEVAMAQAKLADELGFDWVSCSEHHYTPLLQTPNAAVFAAALSQVVRRAKIAVLGPLVSMNNPVRIAEELAMLDQLSGGRLVVLFLRGTPNEFLAYGTNPDETRARTQEASILITRALTEPQPFGWEGRYYRFRTVSVWPGSVQQPHPPLYYSGNSLESSSFAGTQKNEDSVVSFYPAHIRQPAE